MYWIVVHTDDYGEHVNVDFSETYARLAADDGVYSVEIFRAELVDGTYK